MMSNITEPKITVILSPITWETIKQRFQYLAQCLSQHGPVLFVEPYISFLSPFLNRNLLSHYTPLGRIRTVHPGIIAVTPPICFLPFPNRCPQTQRVNQIILGQYLKVILKKLGFSAGKVISHQFNHLLKNSLEPDIFIYDCADNHGGFSWNDDSVITKMENATVQEADLVTCSARSLIYKLNPDYEESRDKKFFFLPNAVNFDLFDIDRKIDSRRQHSPVKVVYVGTISDRIDWEIMRAAAATESVTIDLFGPYLRCAKEPDSKGISIHGPVDHHRIPEILSQFDVAIIPFQDNEVTKFTNSVKAYEYLAAGLPVVSTGPQELPEEALSHGLMSVAKGPDGFLNEILAAHRDDSNHLISLRKNLARQNSWQARCDRLLNIIEEFMNSK